MTDARRIVTDNIKTICKLRGIKNKQIAEQMGVSEGSISNWFSGRNAIDIDNLYKVCCLLNVSLDQIFGIEPLNPEIVLSDDEARLIAAYRSSDPKIKDAALTMLENDAAQKKDSERSAI